MTPPKADPKDQLLDAALMHVPFDGWSPATFNAAIKDSGLDPALARADDTGIDGLVERGGRPIENVAGLGKCERFGGGHACLLF